MASCSSILAAARRLPSELGTQSWDFLMSLDPPSPLRSTVLHRSLLLSLGPACRKSPTEERTERRGVPFRGEPSILVPRPLYKLAESLGSSGREGERVRRPSGGERAWIPGRRPGRASRRSSRFPRRGNRRAVGPSPPEAPRTCRERSEKNIDRGEARCYLMAKFVIKYF
jgi:hypothetical protein